MALEFVLPTTALINFLNKAYKMPPQINLFLLDKFDNLEERNAANFKMLIGYYLTAKQGKDAFSDAGDVLINLDSKMQSIAADDELMSRTVNDMLAYAVLITYL